MSMRSFASSFQVTVEQAEETQVLSVRKYDPSFPPEKWACVLLTFILTFKSFNTSHNKRCHFV